MSTATSRSADLRLPNRYRVSRVIGRGGTAVVLQAQDLRLQREVAIKDRAAALAARTVGAAGAVVITLEHGDSILQAVSGIDGAAARELAARTATSGPETGSVPIVGSRGESLGRLVVTHPTLAADEQQQLTDIAYLVGQVLELRAATRRALLSR